MFSVIFIFTFVCILCRWRKQYKSIIQERVEMAKVNERKSAEERLQEEAERKRHEEEEWLKVLEEERKKKEEEQRLMMMEEEEKRLREENERLKQMEEERKSREIQLLAGDSELPAQNKQQTQEPQNNQHKAESLNNRPKQTKVKFDEESRLYEQLKVLQAQKQKENGQNETASNDTSPAVDNRVIDIETVRQKHKEKVTVSKESARQLNEQKRSENETKMQKQLVKMREQSILEREKWKKLHQNSEKTDCRQKQAKGKEAEKKEELSKKEEEEKAQQEQSENEMNKLILIQKNKDTSLENLTQNKQMAVEEHNSPVQISPEVTSAHAKHELKLRLSTDFSEKSVKSDNIIALWNEADGHTDSKIASKLQKPNAAVCPVKDSTSKDVSNAWEKAVEAKRLKWMHGCESWRYSH